jgi:peroxiredoxin Q/BCP
MNAYRDQYAQLFNNGNGVSVLAISTDKQQTQAAWAREAGYPMTFASDADLVASRAYGVVWNLLITRLDRRVVFVIGKDGRIRHVIRPFRELVQSSYDDLGKAVAEARAAP